MTEEGRKMGFSLEGLQRKARMLEGDVEGQSTLIALGAAQFLQDCPDPYSQAMAVEAWTDAIWGGIVTC